MRKPLGSWECGPCTCRHLSGRAPLHVCVLIYYVRFQDIFQFFN